MPNLDNRTKAKAVWVAAMLAPVVAVQGVRFLVVGEAAPASAAAANITSVPPVASAPEAAKPLTPAQEKAAAWLRSRAVTLNLRSPMDRPDPIIAVQPEPVVEPSAPAPAPAPAPVAKADDTPRNLKLTGILGGGSENARSLASINHRIYRVGDEVAPNWRVASIDSRARIVRLESADGRSLMLSPPQP